MLQKPIPLFLSSCFFALVSAQTPTHRNVSIDDQSPLIDYVPRTSWSLTDAGDWDAGEGRAHMVTNDADAYATFRFIGVAFYYYSALWPYRVGTGIRVDGGPVTVIDQQDHDSAPTAENQGPSVRAQVLSSVTGLSNSEHTIQILPPPGYGVAVVDFFMYTELIEGESSSSSSGQPPSSRSSTPPGSEETAAGGRPGSEDKQTGLSMAAIIGIALAAVSAILLAVVLIMISRWLRKKRLQTSPPPGPTYGAYQGDQNSVFSGRLQQQSPSPGPDLMAPYLGATPSIANSHPGSIFSNHNTSMVPSYLQPQAMAPVAETQPPFVFSGHSQRQSPSPVPDRMGLYLDSTPSMSTSHLGSSLLSNQNTSMVATSYPQPQGLAPVVENQPPPYSNAMPAAIGSSHRIYGGSGTQMQTSSYYPHLNATADGSDNYVWYPDSKKM